ncbi:hypothetical protein BDZ94DRAFT_1316445 [Collybia nuda]|uniref:Uncharacterized protein n=1 Tax=Collybia nuda TaxID=64659 RepID=A0A9P5XPL3_9AGAR|nr:hypothetical protein BDZ94DRAFT_1316445 [Collybia nuda]
MLVAFRRSLVHNRFLFVRAKLCSSVTHTSFESSTNYKPSLSHLKAFLKKPANHPNTHAYINTYLDHNLTTVSNAAALYEELIATLLRQHFYKEAIEIYQRMLNEAIVPTLETRARMVALAFSLFGSADEMAKAVDVLVDDSLTQATLRVSWSTPFILRLLAAASHIFKIYWWLGQATSYLHKDWCPNLSRRRSVMVMWMLRSQRYSSIGITRQQALTRSIMEKHPDDVGKYITPSLEQLKRDVNPHAFSSLPLEHILLRAILAGTPVPRYTRPNSYVAERIRQGRIWFFVQVRLALGNQT